MSPRSGRVRRFAARLRHVFDGRRLDRDLEDEIASHIDEAAEEYERQGLSPADARRAALRSFGGVTQTVERHRDVRTWPSLESLGRDVSRAVRLLRRSPSITVAALLSLALGLGGTTTMYLLLNGLLLRPLPVRDPGALVTVIAGDETRSWKALVWERLRDRTDIFDGLVAWDARSMDLIERGEAQAVEGLLVSGGFFDVLGVASLRGRLLRADDDATGGGPDGPVAVISHGFWQRQYGGAADVVGRPLRVNATTVTIVGVTPASFFGPEVGRTFDVAVPLATAAAFSPDLPPDRALGSLWLAIMARLRPGRSPETAQAALHAAMPGILESVRARETPYVRLSEVQREAMARPRVESTPGGPSTARDEYERSVVTATAIAVVVLLIACVNLAHLFLARGEGRRRELAIALALGATRARLVRQLVIEGLVLTVAGAAAGLILALWAAPAVVEELSGVFRPVTVPLPLDGRLLGLVSLTTVATALLFSVVPAVRVTRLAPRSTLADTTGVVPGATDGRLNGLFVVLQVGLSLALAVSAALLVGTFIRLQQHDLGFDPDAVLTLNVSLKSPAADNDDAVMRNRRILEAVEAMPEVARAAFANVTPLTPFRMTWTLAPAGAASPEGDREIYALNITPGWLEAMGLRLDAGRSYTWDDIGGPAVIVVNRTLARLFFADQPAIGRRVETPDGRASYTVVGVVEDAVYQSARAGAPPTAYFLFDGGFGTFSVRAAGGNAARLRRAVVDTILRIDPDVLIAANPLSDLARASVAGERVTAMIAGFFGVLALVVAGVGTYGVMACAAKRRQSEIAIRRALGASRGNVTSHVVGRGLRRVAVGVALGLGISGAAGSLLEPLLYGVGPRDLPTFAGAGVLLVLVGLAATWIPARRAARVDPASLLRES